MILSNNQFLMDKDNMKERIIKQTKYNVWLIYIII